MATTSKARPSRNRVSGARRKGADSKASALRLNAREYSLPAGLMLAIEVHRKALQIALTLLTGVDATLQQAEDSGGDILDAGDSADALVLRARAIARPLDMVRLAIQGVYQVHAGLDSYNLGRAAGDAK